MSSNPIDDYTQHADPPGQDYSITLGTPMIERRLNLLGFQIKITMKAKIT